MSPFFIIFLFVLGTLVGSFLNVLIDRLPNNISPWKGRSKCDHCHHILSPLDLIPLVSFLLLRGRCRYCHKKLSWQYPLMELVTGCMFVILFFNISTYHLSLISYFPLLIIFSSFLVMFVADLKDQIIPDEMVISVALGTLLYIALQGYPLLPHLVSGIVASLFFLIIFLVTRGRGMGFGDVKLVFVLGLFLGFPNIIVGLYLAFLTGAVLSLILILLKKKRFGQHIAFGPFLLIGTTLSYFIGDKIILWYLNILNI